MHTGSQLPVPTSPAVPRNRSPEPLPSTTHLAHGLHHDTRTAIAPVNDHLPSNYPIASTSVTTSTLTTDRLHHAAPSAKALFAAAAERNHHLGVLARGLIELLNAYGPVALERAIGAALQSDAAYLGGVRHFIDQHRKESHQPPALALDLPDDPRLRTLSVRPHDLADYDRLHDESGSGDDDHEQHNRE